VTREPKAHDEAPSQVNDHPFEPRGEWWSLCKHCGLARASHSSSTIDVRKAMFADQMKRYGEIRHVDPDRKAKLEAEFSNFAEFRSGDERVQIGYYSDDNPENE
jgi:hypothetical protein